MSHSMARHIPTDRRRRFIALLLTAAIVTVGAAQARAGTIWVPGTGGTSFVTIESIREVKFSEVVRQQYDFSCGSAALATLLTFHYGHPTDERTTFGAMYAAGDQEKIAALGFSLLDMKRYLETIGYQADGYQSSLDTLARAQIPAIALINHRGYRHFVVIKGIKNDEVLIGDPALGLRYLPRAEFDATWENRILFIIRNDAEVGRRQFNVGTTWQKLARAPLGTAISKDSLASLTVTLPHLGEF